MRYDLTLYIAQCKKWELTKGMIKIAGKNMLIYLFQCLLQYEQSQLAVRSLYEREQASP
jgi:hypothetical protein